MRIYVSKVEQIRQLLMDPLFADQSFRAISRFVGCEHHMVKKQYDHLLAEGLVPPRPPSPMMKSKARAKAREAEVIAALMDPARQTEAMKDIAKALGVTYRSVRYRYQKLCAEGIVPKRRSGVPKGVKTQDRKRRVPAPRRKPWPRSSSA